MIPTRTDGAQLSAATCQTYHCYKGGPAEPPEGLATGGCPLHSHPAQLSDNKNCVLCMDCLKACPHTSVEVNLRPPGVDLWTGHKPATSEVALMFMLLGGGAIPQALLSAVFFLLFAFNFVWTFSLFVLLFVSADCFV